MIYSCCDENRRRRVRAHPTLNGIDYLEVLDSEAVPLGSPRQRTLLVRFVKAAPALDAANFAISGGERIGDVAILWATRADAPDPALTSVAERAWLTALPQADEVIALRTSSSGDYSRYTLHLVAGTDALAPPPGIDPLLAQVGFSFKVECPSEFDCAPADVCVEPTAPAPQIDYLAKDYRSFRRLMLDRMGQTLPTWTERNPADLGVALVELLAYVGDQLSYAQDAVATEAYIGTARRRVSVRRHARLVDYPMHDGANARAWVQVLVEGGPVALRRDGTAFLTRLPDVPLLIPPSPDPLFERLLFQKPVVFEPLAHAVLFEAHNEIFLHDWGEGECCLPGGATRATLAGDFPDLAAGDVLVFEEILGPHTGRAADADPRKRRAVRLVQVAAGLEDPLTDPPTPVTEIRWAAEDALPFALCLTARTGADFGGELVGPVTRVLGNIVAADHGLTRTGIPIGAVPEPFLYLAVRNGRCVPDERLAVPPRFSPVLPDAPVTQAADPPAGATPASLALRQAPGDVRARVTLESRSPDGGSEAWTAKRDLLGSDPSKPHVVVEVEEDGSARLRFGDDARGKRPAPGTAFAASYRIGNGPGGNIGADALAHVMTVTNAVVGVRNPLPAEGGLAPESIAAVRVAAPQAFRVQQRAVTPDDYAALALRYPGVQRAAASFRWNGHGHTVFVTVDRLGGRAITDEFEAGLIAFLEPLRMAGYDLEIDDPHYVSIELALTVCAAPGYFRADVKAAILAVLSSGTLADGSLGLFHPDNFTFAQDVHLSTILARVRAIDGVESVVATVFRRQGLPDPTPLATGVLAIGRLEIARLAGDRDFPERGQLTVTMGGGR